MKKIIAIISFTCLSFSTNAKCLYGVGFESNVTFSKAASENELGQFQRSFRTPAVGVKCGKFTVSTTDLSGLNEGYTLKTKHGDVNVEMRRWSVGYNLYQKHYDGVLYGAGVSLSRIKRVVNGDTERYYQPFLVVFGLHKSSRIGTFLSVSEKDSVKQINLGFYYVFGY